MNYLYPIVAAALLLVPAVAYAHSAPPADPGMTTPPPDALPGQRGDGGMIVKPPQTDPKSIATPSKNLDPGIDDATGKIDRKNRDALRGKAKPRRQAAPPPPAA